MAISPQKTRTIHDKLTTFLRRCAAMNVVNLAKQYSIAADVALEAEDHDGRGYALNITKAIDAIGMLRFPTTWQAVRDQECSVPTVDTALALGNGDCR